MDEPRPLPEPAPQPVEPTIPHAPDEAAKLKIGIQSIESREAFVAQTINKYQILGAAEENRLRDITRDQFEVWALEDLADLAAETVYEAAEIARLEQILRDRRLVVIVGDGEIGKRTVSLFLGFRLGSGKASHEILCSSGLAADVRVSLDKLAVDREKFGHTAIIFQDAFSSRNQDLLRLIGRLDSQSLRRLTGRLEEAGIHVILTSDSSRLPGEEALPRLRGLDVLHELSGPGSEGVLRFLFRRVERLASSGDESLRSKADAMVQDHSRLLLEELRTIPRIARFVDSYLYDLAEGKLELEEALRRMSHRADWLLDDLTEDLQTWTFSLALILSQAIPAPDGVPWYQLQRFWHALTRHLQKELRTFGPARLTTDAAFLEKVGAEVRSSHFPAADRVRFRNADPAALWSDLLGPGRALVSSLVPLLQELASGDDFSLRESAARALGRIGRIDPRHIVFPLIIGWSHSPKESHHVALGLLMQSVLVAGEDDDAYREACLYHLRRSVQNGKENQVWAGAVALREIGRMDLGLALGDLVELLASALDGRIGHVSPEDRDTLKIAERLERIEAETTEEWMDEGRGIVMPLMFTKPEQEAIAAVQYAVVGLCFSLDPVEVLADLRERLAAKMDGKLQPALALLFLRKGGIADILEQHKLPVPLPKDGSQRTRTVRLSELVVALSHGPEAVRSLSSMAEAVFRGTEAFPGWVCRSFRFRFRELLKAWARESLEIPQIRDACADLFAELLASSHAELKDLIFRLLQQDQDFADADEALGRWAFDALLRRPIGGRPLARDS